MSESDGTAVFLWISALTRTRKCVRDLYALCKLIPVFWIAANRSRTDWKYRSNFDRC